MINAHELMLNNWVKDNKRNRLVQMGGLEPSQNAIWVNYAHGSGQYKIDLSDIAPIPLSPDLLVKARFEHIHLGGSSMIVQDKPYGTKSYTVTRNTDVSGSYWCAIVTDFPPTSEKVGTDTVFIRRDLRYIHQLQNLLTALGQPLNISL